MNGVLLIIRKDTPVNFIGTTVSEFMDRINEMHLEDPLSKNDLYIMDRKANIFLANTGYRMACNDHRFALPRGCRDW